MTRRARFDPGCRSGLHPEPETPPDMQFASLKVLLGCCMDDSRLCINLLQGCCRAASAAAWTTADYALDCCRAAACGCCTGDNGLCIKLLQGSQDASPAEAARMLL